MCVFNYISIKNVTKMENCKGKILEIKKSV